MPNLDVPECYLIPWRMCRVCELCRFFGDCEDMRSDYYWDMIND